MNINIVDEYKYEHDTSKNLEENMSKMYDLLDDDIKRKELTLSDDESDEMKDMILDVYISMQFKDVFETNAEDKRMKLYGLLPDVAGNGLMYLE